jgi:hypothetical protein
MAHPSRKALAYVEKAQKMDWSDLIELWGQIKRGHTPGWEAGKALEHLVVRAFKLSDLDAEYSYDVPLTGKPIEQIDAIIYLDDLAFLIECKDVHRVNASVIAKMKQQLERRPATTFGCIFVMGAFTEPALVVADMSPPQRILLWPGGDIAKALEAKNFKSALCDKYRHLCRFGMTDSLFFYRTLKLT